jgi:hypothetical protein
LKFHESFDANEPIEALLVPEADISEA